MTIEDVLRRHGVNARGARTLADAFDSLDDLWETPLEDIEAIDGIGQKTNRQLAELYPDKTPLPLSEVADRNTITVDGLDIPISMIERPNSVPSTVEDRLIDYATRVLEAVPRLSRESNPDQHLGHHTDIQRSMSDWAATEDAPTDARHVVQAFTPSERNFGRLNAPKAETPQETFGTRLRKAEIVLAWADDTFDPNALENVRDSVDDKYAEALAEAAEALADRRRGKQLLNDPPEQINGWKYVSTAHDGFALAYRGWSQGTRHMVTVAYRDSNGDLQVDQFAYPAWTCEADRDPCAIRENKRLVFDEIDTKTEAASMLLDKLESWAGHPDHDPAEYPTGVNGWLLRYVDESNLQQFEYVEPDEDESLSAKRDGEDFPWWVRYEDPDGRTTDVWEDDTLAGAREVLLEAAVRMTPVEGGGSLSRHAEIARNLHRVDDGEPAVDPVHHDDENARTSPESVGVWTQQPDHNSLKPLAEVVWTDGSVDAGVLEYDRLVAVYRKDDGGYRVIHEDCESAGSASANEPVEITVGRDWNVVIATTEEWLAEHPADGHEQEHTENTSGQGVGSADATDQARLY